MKIFDLTHEIRTKMPVFPGTKPPIIIDEATVEKDYFAEKSLSFWSHTGTHVDVPAHILKNGKKLDSMPPEHFIGKGVLLDFSKINRTTIELSDIKKFQKRIEKIDFLLLLTGWNKYWGKEKYFDRFPVLSHDVSCWLKKFKLKGIGTDTISIDRTNPVKLDNHKVLLSKEIIIIENLTNLQKLINKKFTFICLPLKIKHGDGSPIRAIAIIN